MVPETTPELYLRGACAAEDLEALLLKLRMLCDPGKTRLVWYDEQIMSNPDRKITEQQPAKRSKTSGQLFRLRHQAEVAMVDAGGDEAGRAFCGDASAELAAAGKDGAERASYVVVERAPPSRPGEAVGLRHRSYNEMVEIASGVDFFKGLGLSLRPERRDVRSRRYVFPDGIVAAVCRSRRWKDAAGGGGGAFEDEHAGFLVELYVKVADANLEAAAKQGLLHARETLAPALHPIGK